jgi:hypothetical protein
VKRREIQRMDKRNMNEKINNFEEIRGIFERNTLVKMLKLRLWLCAFKEQRE